MTLYHFSEEAGIRVFEPRIAPSAELEAPVVWAIDASHAVMYYFPRDCPRGCYWPGAATTQEDRARLFAVGDARMVIAIESRWLDRIRATTLYRYTMPESTFVRARGDDSGHHISREPVVPHSVEPMPDLSAAIALENVELRVMPSLIGLWREVIQSSMQFSGTRLRNAQGWDSIDWDAIPLGVYGRRWVETRNARDDEPDQG